jgi:NAD(P)-dependent dehydrogenase (short-subunit alcohol dehydrogenase family)
MRRSGGLPSDPPGGFMIRGKTILITGASSGLGRGMAVALSHGDNNLVVTARRAPLLEELKAEVEANGSRCIVVPADATDPAAAQAVLDAGIEAFSSVDIAIINAGGANPVTMGDAALDDVTWPMRVNYDTLVHTLVPAINHMKGRAGTIAWTGSPAGFFGLPRSGPYSAAKSAGRVLMDTCRIELAGSGIRFVSLYPGFTHTPGLATEEVPFKALIIPQERAVKEMLGAIERGKNHHMFPKRIAWLMVLARMLPEWLRRRVLGAFS